MIADLKPYPAMKESGVPWMGEVPEHWEMERGKWLFRKMARPIQDTDEVVTCFRDGIVTLRKNRRVRGFTESLKEIGYQGICRGDLVIHGMDAFAGAIGVADSDGKGTPVYSVCEPGPTANAQYYAYALREMARSQWIQALAKGIRERSTDFRFEGFGAQSVPLPPLPEQAAIVRFLDHADRRIRRYIRAKQKLITLLEEQKQALIHRAVTRGLDPNVRLKSSGVEWLGDVPEHWEVRRNGRLFVQRNETGFPELPILEVSLNTGIRIRDFGNSDRKQIMAVRSEYKRAVKGDIAYNMMRMWQGAVGVIPVDGLVSPAYVVARPLKGTESRYFSALFRTNAYMDEVDKYSHGIVKDRNRLYWEDFKQMPTPYPPPDEQGCIVRYLDKTTDDIDTVVARGRQEIDLLREYRTRLIGDVVTGKLDVRESAAQLPDEVEEQELLDETDALIDGDGAADDLDTTPEEATV